MAENDLKHLAREALKTFDSGNTVSLPSLVTADYRKHQEPGLTAYSDAAELARTRELLGSYHENVLGAHYRKLNQHHMSGGERTLNLEDWLDHLKRHHEAFSNSTVEFLSQVAEGDMVATRWRVSAVHTGNVAGMAPSGRHLTWTGVNTDRFEDGKIAETWVNWDIFSFLQGLLPR